MMWVCMCTNGGWDMCVCARVYVCKCTRALSYYYLSSSAVLQLWPPSSGGRGTFQCPVIKGKQPDDQQCEEMKPTELAIYTDWLNEAVECT